MRLVHLALLFSLVCVASSADKLWLADCEMQCVRSASRYKNLRKQYPKDKDLEKQMIKLCEEEDKQNRRITVCRTAVALILDNYKAENESKVGNMDIRLLSAYCKFGCERKVPKR